MLRALKHIGRPFPRIDQPSGFDHRARPFDTDEGQRRVQCFRRGRLRASDRMVWRYRNYPIPVSAGRLKGLTIGHNDKFNEFLPIGSLAN